MGYTTDFDGQVSVVPPLNEAERDYLRRFSGTRRMTREAGPYFADPRDDFGQGDRGGVLDYNTPHEGQPGLWCQWVPTDDGCFIEWDGGEKFYESEAWMAYLIDTFLREGATVSTLTTDDSDWQPEFASFTFDHVVNGIIYAQGEDPDDRWSLIVTDNDVRVLTDGEQSEAEKQDARAGAFREAIERVQAMRDEFERDSPEDEADLLDSEPYGRRQGTLDTYAQVLDVLQSLAHDGSTRTGLEVR